MSQISASAVAPVVPVHPQRGAVPEELRWVTSASVLANQPLGDRTTPAQLPESLAELVIDGTLTAVRIESGCLITRLAPTRSWSAEGQRVRTAVHAALGEPWPSVGEHLDGDERIRQAAQGLLDGPVGDLARSHGGRIELLGVSGGVVDVALDGACHGCPASRSTLLDQLEAPLRAACPDVVAVREAKSSGGVRNLFRESRERGARTGTTVRLVLGERPRGNDHV